MKFDNVIIGGGLSGLTAAIRLTENGKKTAVISSGQSALHFCGGAFGLLGNVNGKPVDSPLDSVSGLSDFHPYKKIGNEKFEQLCKAVPDFFYRCGIRLVGDCNRNHSTLTPFGKIRSSWLSLEELPHFNSIEELKNKKYIIFNIKSFLEFYPLFIADNLEKYGISIRHATFEIAKLSRANCDMRSVSISKLLDANTVNEIAQQINTIADSDETVIVPAIFGIKNDEIFQNLCKLVPNKIMPITTLPISVVGVRIQHQLQKYYKKIGGTLIIGDKVTGGDINGDRVKSIKTANLGCDYLEADNFVLASGSILSEGLIATPNKFYEPVFDLDIDFPPNRDDWYNSDFFSTQPYMNIGIKTDNTFRPYFKNLQLTNLYVCGAGLSDCNPLVEDSGAGISILSAMYVADMILNLD